MGCGIPCSLRLLSRSTNRFLQKVTNYKICSLNVQQLHPHPLKAQTTRAITLIYGMQVHQLNVNGTTACLKSYLLISAKTLISIICSYLSWFQRDIWKLAHWRNLYSSDILLAVKVSPISLSLGWGCRSIGTRGGQNWTLNVLQLL